MFDAPIALAFAAGLVATLNPCGFAMLPAYLSYFIGSGSDGVRSRPDAVGRALAVGGSVSLGFLAVFGAAGILITAGFRSIIDLIPWLALIVGALVAVFGVAMLAGFEPVIGLPKIGGRRRDRGHRSMFAFGVSYAVASLSCTLPVFLTVVAAQITSASFAAGVVTFVAYGAGMSSLLLGITIVVAIGRQSLLSRLRAAMRYVNRVSGAILLMAGSYIVWFWWTNISGGAVALSGSGPFRFVENLSQRALQLVGDRPVLWAAVLAAVIGASGAYARLGGRNVDDDVESGSREPAGQRV